MNMNIPPIKRQNRKYPNILQPKFWRPILFCGMLLMEWATATAQTPKGTYRSHQWLYGPHLGVGFVSGRKDLPGIATRNPLGAGMQMGLGVSRFYKTNKSVGIAAEVVRNTWGAERLVNQDQGVARYRYKIGETLVQLPLDFTYYLTPYRQRFYFSFIGGAGFVIQHTQQRLGGMGADTNAVALSFGTATHKRYFWQAGLRIGYEWDNDFATSNRCFIQFRYHQIPGVVGKPTQAISFMAGVQFLWAK